MADGADAHILAALAHAKCLPTLVSADASIQALLSFEVLVPIVCNCLMQCQQMEEEEHLEFLASSSYDHDTFKAMGVAARHRMGSQLATALKQLGYAGDCGYNHFLYPSEKDVRHLLVWLLGKLPRASAPQHVVDGVKSDSHASMALEKTHVAEIFRHWMKKRTSAKLLDRQLHSIRGFQAITTWKHGQALLEFTTVHDMMRKRKRLTLSNDLLDSTLLDEMEQEQDEATSSENDKEALFELATKLEAARAKQQEELTTIVRKDVPAVAAAEMKRDQTEEQPVDQQLALGALDQNHCNASEKNTPADKHNESNDRVTHTEQEPTKMEDEISLLQVQEHEQMLSHLHTRVVDTRQRIRELRSSLTQEHLGIQEAEHSIAATRAKAEESQQTLATRKQMTDLLPHAQENIGKLTAICEKNHAKLRELEHEWETHRQPLLQEEQVLLSVKSSRKARCREFIREMKEFRTEMKDMAVAIQHKMETMHQLEATYAQLPHQLNRHMYTNRIMDIIKQVHKQKREIAKIIHDIHAIQKQLNFTAEKLKRTEAVTDEKLYGAALQATERTRNDYVACYRKFAQVRELFEELILVIGDVGKKENAARDLENWISQLQSRESSNQLDKVLMDLQSIKLENASLSDQLRLQVAS